MLMIITRDSQVSLDLLWIYTGSSDLTVILFSKVFLHLISPGDLCVHEALFVVLGILDDFSLPFLLFIFISTYVSKVTTQWLTRWRKMSFLEHLILCIKSSKRTCSSVNYPTVFLQT